MSSVEVFRCKRNVFVAGVAAGLHGVHQSTSWIDLKCEPIHRLDQVQSADAGQLVGIMLGNVQFVIFHNVCMWCEKAVIWRVCGVMGAVGAQMWRLVDSSGYGQVCIDVMKRTSITIERRTRLFHGSDEFCPLFARLQNGRSTPVRCPGFSCAWIVMKFRLAAPRTTIRQKIVEV